MAVDQIPPLTPPELEALLERLRQRRRAPRSRSEGDAADATSDRVCAPLSYGQDRVYGAARLAADASVYNMPLAFLVRGLLDADRVRASLQILTMRHETLRTAFRLDGGSTVQIIMPRVEIRLIERRLAEGADATNLIADEISQPFALDQAPLVRVLLAAARADEWLLVITFHHLVCDGWSTGIFLRELADVYRSHGSESALPGLPVQYRHYVAWQRHAAEGDAADSALAYWRTSLAGARPFLALPQMRRTAVATDAGGYESRALPADLTADLQALTLRHGATLFMVLNAVQQVLLHYYSEQTDFLILSPVADRRLAGTEHLIGYFVSFLPVRAALDGDPSFRDLLGRVRRAVLDGVSRCHGSTAGRLDDLRGAHPFCGAEGITPILNVRNEPRPVVTIDGLSLEPLTVPQRTTRGSFILNAEIHGTRLHLLLEYRSDLFEPNTMRAMLDRLEDLIRRICHDVNVRLSDLCTHLTHRDRLARCADEQRLTSAATARLARLRMGGPR